MQHREGETLSAMSVATDTLGADIIRSSAIVIRNTNDEPIVLVVMVAPRLYHIYSVLNDPAEFREALRTHGISQVPVVKKIDL